jgi:hypothetical protein
VSDRKTKLCPVCRHIHWEDEPHECPTPEYLAERDRLIAEACEEDENRPPDENGKRIEL